MKIVKYAFLMSLVLLTASCGGSGSGDSPPNDEGRFPANIIGLWGFGGDSLYLQLSAPFRAESWDLDSQRNCFNYIFDILTPLGGNDYRDSAGDVANITGSSSGNLLNFRLGSINATFSRQVGLAASDLPVCSSKLDANSAQQEASGFFARLPLANGDDQSVVR